MSLLDEREIFLAALDCASEQERNEFLQKACSDSPPLRAAVDALLAMHDRTQNLLDEVPAPVASVRAKLDSDAGLDPNATANFFGSGAPAVDRSGEQIGPYKLLEKIGEGGFGQVYVAEQQQPVRRRVALKLLKPGMDSREVTIRFEAERQALALMSHPNIAHVFDAGTTISGQPYFVMELVRGVPITHYCDECQLTTRDRLLLFIDVCRAVQHAHQKGIIHRDLKPSNVMITLHDGVPVVKVIDFGVAKALSEPLTDKTLYTRFTQMIGTPLYMSPEQAEMSGLDVDTRSDIYALGVMLYELLTCMTPFDQRRLNTAGFDELRRIIREEEPPRPSVRISTSAQLLTTTSAKQRTEPRVLSSTLRGDLDWIVMKALDKDRRRRYQTAGEFAEDVERYLDQQPVIARPPSPWYRFKKMARRNKVALTTASLVLAAMIAGTAVSTWQAIRANQARAEADELRQKAEDFATTLKEANVLLDSARANADEKQWGLAYRQYTKATELQPNHYLVWSGRASLYLRLGLWTQAASDFEKAIQLGAPANNPGWWGVPVLLLYAEREPTYEVIAQRMWEQLDRPAHPYFGLVLIRNITGAPLQGVSADHVAERAEEILLALENDSFQGPPPFEGPFGDRGDPGFPPPPRGDRRRPQRDRGPDGPGGPRRNGPRGAPEGIPLYVAALANVRAGRYERAQQLATQVVDDDRWVAHDLAFAVLAIVHHHAGNASDAERAVQQLEELVERWHQQIADNSSESIDSLEFLWLDYVEGVVLYREVHRLVRGTTLVDDPRATEAEERALGVLQ